MKITENDYNSIKKYIENCRANDYEDKDIIAGDGFEAGIIHERKRLLKIFKKNQAVFASKACFDASIAAIRRSK